MDFIASEVFFAILNVVFRLRKIEVMFYAIKLIMFEV